MKTKFSDLLLEKFLLGELNAAKKRHISDALEDMPDLQARLEEMRRSSQEFTERHPIDQIRRRLTSAGQVGPKRHDPSPGSTRRWIAALAPVPVAALLLVMIEASEKRPVHDGDRTKGIRTELQIYRKKGKSLEKLADGESVNARDLVQLSYTTEKKKYGAIVSVDGDKRMTMHWPEKPGPAVLLEAGREVPLPSAFELDSSPRFEAFVLVTSEHPFETDPLLQQLRAGALNPRTGRFEAGLPIDMQMFVMTLRKIP